MSASDVPKPLAKALGRIPSGLFVLTAGPFGAETGLLVSWVQQCSFDPPMVSVALRRGRPIAGLLAVGEPFTVNVVGEGQKHLIAHFGRGFEPGQPAFEGVALERHDGHPPALAEAVAHLACRV